MPSQLLNTKPVEKILPGTAMEGPQDAVGPLSFLSSLGNLLLTRRKKSLDNCQQEETSG
jgi:hypothetical protein